MHQFYKHVIQWDYKFSYLWYEGTPNSETKKSTSLKSISFNKSSTWLQILEYLVSHHTLVLECVKGRKTSKCLKFLIV